VLRSSILELSVVVSIFDWAIIFCFPPELLTDFISILLCTGDEDRPAATRRSAKKTEGAKKKGGFSGFSLKPSSKDTAKRAGEE
jgi:hypothetical protein